MIQIHFKPKSYLTEAIRCGFTYSLIDHNGKAYHSPIQCKDFLSDAFWSEHARKSIDVYGFHWSPGIVAVNDSWYYLGLTHSGYEDFGKFADSIQSFLWAFDVALGYKHSVVEPANDNKALFVTFDGAWTKNPFLVSTITQLVRLGPMYDGSEIKDWIKNLKKPFIAYDEGRLHRMKPRLLRLLEGETPAQTYTEFTDAYNAHVNSGLVDYNWK